MLWIAFVSLSLAAAPKTAKKKAPEAPSAFVLEPQLGHASGITSLSVDPAGTHVVTGSNDGTVRLWELATGKQVRKYSVKTRTADGATATFSHDGKTIYMMRPSNFTYNFDRATGESVGEFHSIGTYAGTSAQYVAVGTLSVLLFPSLGGRGFNGVNPHPYDGEPAMPVYAKIEIDKDLNAKHAEAVVFANHDKVVVINADKQLITWSLTTKAYLSHVDNPGMKAALLSVHDTDVLTVTNKTIEVRDLAKLSVSRKIDTGVEVRCASFAPDGKSVLSCEGPAALARDATTFAVTQRYALSGAPSHVVVTPDGSRVVFAVGRDLYVFARASGVLLQHIAPESVAMKTLAFSDEGHRLLAQSDATTPAISVWNLDEARREAHFEVGAGAKVFFADASGEHVVGVDRKGYFRAQVTTGAVHYTATTGSPVSCADYRRGKWLSCDATGCGVTAEGAPRQPLPKLPSTDCPRWLDDHTVVHQHRDAGYNAIVTAYDVTSGVPTVLLTADSGLHTNGEPGVYSNVRKWFSCNAKSCSKFEVTTNDETMTYFITPARSPDGHLFASGGDIMGTLFVYDDKGGPLKYELFGHAVPGARVTFSADSRWLASAASDGGVFLWDMRDGKLAARLFDGSQQWLLTTPDGYFDASQYGGGFVAMVRGDHASAIEQFALRNNRPDLILERFGSPRADIREHYQRKYQRRLQKAGLDEGSLAALPNSVPETTVSAKSDGKEATLDIRCTDAAADLRSYNVFANGVPLLGLGGKPASGRSFNAQERVLLESGTNKLEASCTNTRGLEAFRATVDVVQPGAVKGTLYYLGFGVSAYANPSLALGYAHKDAIDVGVALKGFADRFAEIKVQTSVDADVTPERVRSSKAFVSQSTPDDTVVVFIAGHGMHASGPDATYYYLTHGADPARLAETAADFDAVESLLQDIGARRKLLLMDTCESGEAEPEVVAVAELPGKKARSRSVRGVQVKKTVAAAPAARRGYLLDTDRFIYSDVFRRSGAIVLSSSRGGELSYEGEQWNNGAFTFALKQALSSRDADLDHDGHLSAPELKGYVGRVVAEATSDAQHPTIDRDNTASRLNF